MNITNLKTALIGIPILGVFISFVFFWDKCVFCSTQFFVGNLVCILITAVMWLGNGAIFDYFHRKMPNMEDTMRRSMYLAASCLVYSFVSYVFLKFMLFHHIATFKNDWETFWFDFKITIIFTTLLVVLSETFYFFEQWKTTKLDAEKLKRENTQAQLDSLRNQVNPHFLFNSLNTLVSIIPDCPETAVDFTQKLSNVYRYLLSVRDKELIDLKTELDFIQSYVFLLNVRFGENLRVDIQISNEKFFNYIPPVSLQMLIENAIKHNVVSKEKPLHISIYSENDYLMVKNNIQPKQQKEESTGVGLENIKKRYAILSDKNIEVLHTNAFFTVALPLLKV